MSAAAEMKLKPTPSRRRRYACVTVDVDLDDIELDDLLDEVEARGLMVPREALPEPDNIYTALVLGQDAHAMRLMREYIQAATGRILS